MAEPANGFQLKIYNVDKRRNSTKQPNEVWFYEDPDGDLYISAFCTFKQPTNILEPTVILAVDREDKSEEGSGEFDSYWLVKCNYAQLLGRYYWIKEMTSVSRDHWAIKLFADPLATFKNWIGETEIFAEYWGGGNYELIDTRLPRRTNGHSSGVQFGSLWQSNKQFIVGIISENGFDYYDLQTYSNYQQLMANVNNWLDTTIDMLIAELPNAQDYIKPETGPGSGSTDEGNTAGVASAIKGISKGIGDVFLGAGKFGGDLAIWLLEALSTWIQQGFSKDKIASLVTTAWFYPARVAPTIGGAAVPIKIGNYETNISGVKINQLVYRTDHTLTVPNELSPIEEGSAWYGREQFCHWNLYVPYMGNLAIPADLCRAGSSIITIETNINIGSGACNFRVAIKGFAGATTAITLASTTVQIGGAMNMGTAVNNTTGAVSSGLNGVAGAVAVAAGMATGGAAGLAMTAGGAITCANSAVHFADSVSPVGTTISGASGGCCLEVATPEGTITLTRYCFKVSDNPQNLAKIIGTPKFGVTKVKSCGGYVKANGASFSAKMATADEIEVINAYLNNGLYYE